jgi:hypothetical protein
MALFAAILAICDRVPVAHRVIFIILEGWSSKSRGKVADLAANHSPPFSLSCTHLAWNPADLPQPEHWVERTGASAFMHLLIARTPGLWHHENRLAAGLDVGVGN